MNIKDILAISGKPGLFKMLSQSKNSIIVEGLTDGKRMPVYAAHQISALEEISIYTQTEDKPLKDIFKEIFIKYEGKEAISPKSSATELEAFFREILPDYDQERVYASDIKKVVQWYNLLLKAGLIDVEADEPENTEEEKPQTEE
ncbi:MAG: DUF5606 domain-containing protein [Bacteroidales bacterium]|nr:DUF5606 domain-containing protein [Bacteroidales bacterium]